MTIASIHRATRLARLGAIGIGWPSRRFTAPRAWSGNAQSESDDRRVDPPRRAPGPV